MTITVVLADDQEMVRTGFAMILGAQDDIEVVAECGDGVAAVEAIRRLRPDVALLDIRMPRLSGLDVAAQVGALTNVVVVTTFGHDEYVDQALAAGAYGFLLKDSGPALLVAAVRAAAAGDALISPELTVPLLERTRGPAHRTGRPLPELSARELDVVRLVARGRTNAEICAELHIALGTVKAHLTSIQQRLDARNRVEVAARAWESGLMDA
ncbi:response regulator [Pimelobacter simplex]|uniref:response regulator n=1 Tax=Nocardioides simplex TaxID=2045 RepID=UPI00214F7F9E|nr:response regulator transcription factor [Pimelobacter simplex]UUW90669.1 response regulator transcription factor [Pimelobacter simplex]UUW94498.1 response regulator transcription factor [Pimelobacter simplex]